LLWNQNLLSYERNCLQKINTEILKIRILKNISMPTPKRFYPTLATVVSTDERPEVLGFIKDGLSTMLGKIHFKDLQYSKSPKGDAAFYSLSIVSPKRLALEIPSTGMALQHIKLDAAKAEKSKIGR